MRLIVGLGNPGKEYEQTRHNVGFVVIDRITWPRQIVSSDSWSLEKKFKSEVWEGVIDDQVGGQKIILAKPQTFMNSSGEAVAALVNFHKLSVDQVLIIHDDLDLPLGSFKLQRGTGPKGHNGVLDVERCLGVKGFWRLRIGVDNRPLATPTSTATGEEYVLSNFTKEELAILTGLYSQIRQTITKWVIDK